MVKKKNDNATNIVLLDKYVLRTKFQKRALIPQEAIDRSWLNITCYTVADQNKKNSAIFETTDGHDVHIRLIGCCNNSKGDEIGWMQSVSDATYGLKFEVLQSNWFARFGNLTGYWHLIEMEEVK